MEFDICSKWRSTCKWIDEIQIETLELLSLFVFVLLTTLVAMLNVISPDQLISVLLELDLDTGSFGQDVDDSGEFQRYRGIFPVESDEGMVIPRLNRLAFIVVVGEIVNMANQKAVEYSKYSSLVGVTVYCLLLFLVLGESYSLAWILSIQFLVLVAYSFAVGWIIAKRVWLSERNKSVDSDDDTGEKRPRIRNPRN